MLLDSEEETETDTEGEKKTRDKRVSDIFSGNQTDKERKVTYWAQKADNVWALASACRLKRKRAKDRQEQRYKGGCVYFLIKPPL